RRGLQGTLREAGTEGLIAAPETAHPVRCTMDEALACKKTGEAKVIAFNGSGHGLLDLSAYQNFLAGKLKEFEPAKITVPTYIK
ncbi:MAG: hypothetical protein WCC94_04535, partial [Candidatus Bathyarchaeia archaeon]